MHRVGVGSIIKNTMSIEQHKSRVQKHRNICLKRSTQGDGFTNHISNDAWRDSMPQTGIFHRQMPSNASAVNSPSNRVVLFPAEIWAPLVRPICGSLVETILCSPMYPSVYTWASPANTQHAHIVSAMPTQYPPFLSIAGLCSLHQKCVSLFR